MEVKPISSDKKSTTTKVKRLSLGGMTTGASIFLASSAVNAIMTEPTKSAKEISQIAKRTGKLGLAFSFMSGLLSLGTILYEKV